VWGARKTRKDPSLTLFAQDDNAVGASASGIHVKRTLRDSGQVVRGTRKTADAGVKATTVPVSGVRRDPTATRKRNDGKGPRAAHKCKNVSAPWSTRCRGGRPATIRDARTLGMKLVFTAVLMIAVSGPAAGQDEDFHRVKFLDKPEAVYKAADRAIIAGTRKSTGSRSATTIISSCTFRPKLRSAMWATVWF
jgi:hypothetical protein